MKVKDCIELLSELDPELPMKFKILVGDDGYPFDMNLYDEKVIGEEGIKLHDQPEMGQVGGSHAYMEFYIQ